ncbi:MAG TPA: glycosyltransferase [Gemmataceae bacterium]|jgi:hypothetical protein
MASLTAFFITRNHEASLDRAIRSVQSAASEIVVADTGSTDRTVPLAAELGARLIPIAWADDFAAACNDAVAAATGDWLLWMNPDEELEAGSETAIAAAIANSESFAWLLNVKQQLHPDRPAEGTTGRQYRLFRRVPELRFQGRLHPTLEPSFEALAASRRQSIGLADATIRRHAYLSTPTPDRIRWVVRLLEAELRDRPGQLGFTIELGRNLLWLNDPRGHDVLAEAAEEIRARSAEPVPPSPWVGSLIEYLLSVSPEQNRSKLGRAEARDLALCWFPSTPPVLWAVAAERFAAADYPNAATLLERLIHLGRSGHFDDGGGFSPDIVGPAAILNLGICCLHLARWNDARKWFSEVMNDPSRRAAALHGYDLAERQQKPTA